MDNLELVHQGKYNEFADNIKTRLKQSLSQNSIVKEYIKEIQRIQKQRDAFSAIAKGD